MLYKLLQVGIGSNFYRIITDMYSKTQCSIKLDLYMKKTFACNRGVRQGRILSPVLFNLFLNELPQLLECPEVDPFLLPNGTKLSCLLYADDLVLLSHSQQGLQTALNKLSAFCHTWKMNVNLSKTKLIIFQKTSWKTFNPYLTLNDCIIEKVEEYTYLGIKMTSTGNFSLAENTLKEKALQALFATKRLMDFSF